MTAYKILKHLAIIALAVCATACSHEKKQAKATAVAEPLSKTIVGSWTTEGHQEQIDEYLVAGYGQQIVLKADGTFEMGVVMSISGDMPYEMTTIPVTASFGAEMSGKYSTSNSTLTLVYNADSVVAHMDPDDVIIDVHEDLGNISIDEARQELIAQMEALGLTPEMLSSTLKETIKGNGKDVFTNVSVKDDRLQMTLDGSTTVYIRD